MGKGVGDTVTGKVCHFIDLLAILIKSSGATEGVSKTTKAVGDTGSQYITKATGKDQNAQNPLGL